MTAAAATDGNGATGRGKGKGQGKAKAHAKPGRKRMGKDVFVPVTMKLEPSELATIEMIAKAMLAPGYINHKWSD